MSLSLGTGPFAGSPGGEFNFDLGGAPKHRIFFADFDPRLRALLGDAPLFDTTRAKLLYETGIAPVPYVPLEDFDTSRLERTDHSTHCPFKGDASYWSVDGEENVVWAYEDPNPEAAWLKGYAAVYSKRMDGWLVEDEPVFSSLRDPYHRVDVYPSSRPVAVTADGEVIARSAHPQMLFETGLPGRPYIPRADVSAELTRSETRTACPYKGEATYWSLPGIEDAAWSYETPLPEAAAIAGHIAFDPARVDVELMSPPRPGDPA
jgi:uncharacterized protein (DUF427 family)